MKLIIQLIILTILAACAAPPADMPASSPAPSTQTATPSATASPALDLTPETPTPDTPTITPLPTIPTFTPTFDVRTIVTATPAPKAECPKIASAENASLDFLSLFSDEDNRINLEQNLLDFLNKYGAQALYTAIKSQEYHDEPFLQDLTNDGELEIIVRPLSTYVFGCKSGQYINLLQLPPDTSMTAPKILFINDANRNGIPEITFLTAQYSKGGRTYRIYEWNDDSFVSLLDIPIYEDDIGSGGVFVTVNGEIHFEDIDHDLVQELIVDNGDYVQWAMEPRDLPWRNERIYYKWDGKYFTQWRREFAPPEYRFQSIQDGDLALSQQEYAKALDFYQQAIFNNELKGYSPAMEENLRENHLLGTFSNQPTPTPPPPTPPNTRAWRHTPITAWSSCTPSSVKWMRRRSNTPPCKKNSQWAIPATPTSKWRPSSGTLTSPSDGCTRPAPPPSPMPTPTPRFSSRSAAIITAGRVTSTNRRMFVRFGELFSRQFCYNQNMNTLKIQIPRQALTEFCRRNRIRRLAFFGSVVREDFTPTSDVDVLVEFEPGYAPGLAFFAMQEELSRILGRKVDLNTTGFLSPYFRKQVQEEAVDYVTA